ncbi:MAG: hypothetical protein ACLU4J_18970 [Butyricimonas paravirosa]
MLTMEMSEANVNYSVTNVSLRKAQVGFRCWMVEYVGIAYF